MVEINICKYPVKSIRFRHIFIVLILLFIPPDAYTQDISPEQERQKKIEIINAEMGSK